ncbi:hypothetical protein ABPG75_002147 [Micractinium tetrahymenae]
MARHLAALAPLLLLLGPASAFRVCLTNVGYYPKVTAIGGSYKYLTSWVNDYPDYGACPSGYHKTTADYEVEVTRNIIDAYFIQMVAPVYKGAGACINNLGKPDPNLYLYPNGKKVGSITGGDRYTLSVTSTPHHYGVSGCLANNMKAGKTYIGYAQGVTNYYCGNDPKKTPRRPSSRWPSSRPLGPVWRSEHTAVQPACLPGLGQLSCVLGHCLTKTTLY